MKYIKKFEAKNDINWALMSTIEFDNKLDKVQQLLKHGADINFKNIDRDNRTPLMIAIEREREEIVRYLVDNGANINYQDDDGFTPLMVACEMNSFEMLRTLIEAGADWSLKNSRGKDFFYNLVEYTKEIIIEDYPRQYKEYLMKKNADKYNI